MSASFPQELYRLVPALYPHFADLLNKTDMSAPEFFALSYIKHVGKVLDDGDHVLPLADLRAMLVRIGAYKTDSGASGFITRYLEIEKKFVTLRRLSPGEKQQLFPSSPGYRDAVALTPIGEQKLKDFNKGVERLFQDVTRGVSPVFLRPLLTAFKTVSGSLVERLEELAEERGLRRPLE